jgi:hypothetical protein
MYWNLSLKSGDLDLLCFEIWRIWDIFYLKKNQIFQAEFWRNFVKKNPTGGIIRIRETIVSKPLKIGESEAAPIKAPPWMNSAWTEHFFHWVLVPPPPLPPLPNLPIVEGSKSVPRVHPTGWHSKWMNQVVHLWLLDHSGQRSCQKNLI